MIATVYFTKYTCAMVTDAPILSLLFSADCLSFVPFRQIETI